MIYHHKLRGNPEERGTHLVCFHLLDVLSVIRPAQIGTMTRGKNFPSNPINKPIIHSEYNLRSTRCRCLNQQQHSSSEQQDLVDSWYITNLMHNYVMRHTCDLDKVFSP